MHVGGVPRRQRRRPGCPTPTPSQRARAPCDVGRSTCVSSLLPSRGCHGKDRAGRAAGRGSGSGLLFLGQDRSDERCTGQAKMGGEHSSQGHAWGGRSRPVRKRGVPGPNLNRDLPRHVADVPPRAGDRCAAHRRAELGPWFPGTSAPGCTDPPPSQLTSIY
jgi:hypothetical protein